MPRGHEYEEYDDEERRWPRIAAIVVGVVVVAVVGIALVGGGSNKKKMTSFSVPAAISTSTAPAAGTAVIAGSSLGVPTDSVAAGSVVAGSVDTVDSTVASDPAAAGATDVTDVTVTDATSLAPGGSGSVVAVEPPVPGGGASSTTTVDVAAGAAGPTPTVPPGTPYPADTDGSPRPIVAIFDTDTITLTGQVPSQAAADRLAVLAVANSQTPASVVNNLIVNPAVPISVGVRVIELNSPRFPERSATILPAHAAELDRVANVMRALPNVTVLVIGHADQRGSEVGNFAISDARARAVVNYLVYVGIEPARLSSRAVGDTDLLAAGDDATSLALNRRTEFVFYGLLLP